MVVDQCVRDQNGPSEQYLLRYLEDCYDMGNPIEHHVIQGLLNQHRCDWTTQTDDGCSILHLAVMNEATEAHELFQVVSLLMQMGALPDIKDVDGDTALEAIMQLAHDREQLKQEEGDGDSSKAAKHANMAAVRALLSCPKQVLESVQVFSICSWLKRYMPKEGHNDCLQTLTVRVGVDLVNKAWSSEELLAYLKRKCYNENRSVKAKRVKEYLDVGATPSHTQNGATAMLFVVLNPYSRYSELCEVFRMMMQRDPGVAAVRDGFRLTPMDWAVSYRNVAMQCGLQKANPAVLLALLPCILQYSPPHLDTGEVCLKTSGDGHCRSVFNQQASSTARMRFLEADRVLCKVSCPGGAYEWEEGTIVGLWYRERGWPSDHPGAAYEVKLDIGERVYVLEDSGRIIRSEAEGPPKTVSPNPNSASSAQAKARPGPRFQKQQRADGGWELLDTVSGKTRPTSPPDIDGD